MEEIKKTEPAERKKLTYEELESVAAKMSSELNGQKKKMLEMEKMIIERDYYNMFKRLDYLYMMLDHDKFFESDALEKAAKAIEDIVLGKEETPAVNEDEGVVPHPNE